MPTSEDLKSGDFFFGLAPPTEFANATPRKISFLNWTFYPPPPFPHRGISREKRGPICQGLQLVEYSSNQTLAYIRVTKKNYSFCLPRTTCLTQENEARDRNTGIRSRMILEFWNIWSWNLSFFVGNWSKLPFIRAFGHPEMTQSPLEQRAVELSENVTLLEVQDGSDTNQLKGKQRALEDLPAVNDRRGKVCTRCRTSDYERTNCKKTPCNEVNSCKLKDKHPESLTEIGT